MTERDKRLITILSIVVVLVLFMNYLILPMQNRSAELDTKIADARSQKTEMEAKIVSLPVLERNFADQKTGYLEEAKEYYPIMTSQEIDREITGMVLACGLSADDLQITVPSEPSALAAFYASGLALTGILSSEGVGADSGTDGTEAAAVEADPLEAAEAAAQDPPSPDGAALSGSGENTEVYAAQIQIAATGTEEEFQILIDQVVNDSPALRMTGYSYQTRQGTVTTDAEGNLVSTSEGRTLSLSLELYMCDKTFGGE